MKTFRPIVIFIALLMSTTFYGCKEDESGQNLDIHFHSEFNGEDLNYNQDYLLNGRKVVFTKAQVYLSGFSVKTSPEQTYNDVFLSINPTKHSQEIGTLNVGHTDGLKFYVGLDPVTNHSDPATYPESSVLSSGNDDFEFWTWNSGYRFVVLEGMIDTDAVPDGITDDNFEFHLGTDDFYTLIDLTKHEDIVSGQDFIYNVVVDYAQFFDGIDLANDYVTHTSDNLSLATAVKDNFGKVFSMQ